MMKRLEMKIPISGSNETHIFFCPNICSCGDIEDGVSFAFPGDGGWIISYNDLIKMADAASRQRGLWPHPDKSPEKSASHDKQV